MEPTVAATAGRLGRPARHEAGMRTTTPACSSASTSDKRLHRLARGPAQRMEDLAGIDDRLQPGTAFARPADRFEKLQEFAFRAGAGVFAQGGAERGMTQRAVRGQRGGVGRQERERPLGVLAVLGEVEMYATHLPPAAVARGEERADREAAFPTLRLERPRELLPKRRETAGVEILAAAHRRGFLDKGVQRVLARRRRMNSFGGGLAGRADRGDEAHGESPPERQVGRQTASGFGEAELQQAMPVALAERRLEPLRHVCIERSVVISRFEAQGAVRRQDGGERMEHRSVRMRMISASPFITAGKAHVALPDDLNQYLYTEDLKGCGARGGRREDFGADPQDDAWGCPWLAVDEALAFECCFLSMRALRKGVVFESVRQKGEARKKAMRRWNGWGDETVEAHLNAAALRFLKARIGEATAPGDVTRESVVAKIPPSRLPEHRLVSRDPEARLRASVGQSLEDWLRLRFGTLGAVVDGVAFPETRGRGPRGAEGCGRRAAPSLFRSAARPASSAI